MCMFILTNTTSRVCVYGMPDGYMVLVAYNHLPVDRALPN